jgi:hypothetical protein
MGAVENLILEGMRKLQQAHIILNHIKAQHDIVVTKQIDAYLEEPECQE